MAEYNLTNIGHNSTGKPHEQYDFTTYYTSKYSGNNLNTNVKVLDIDFISDVTQLLSDNYYGYTGVKRIDLEFEITILNDASTPIVGNVILSAQINSNGTNDAITFSGSDRFFVNASVNWLSTGNYAQPNQSDQRLNLTLLAKRDSSYVGGDGISRYNIKLYSQIHRYASVSVRPKSVNFLTSDRIDNVVKTTAWSATNPFANPRSNTKDKFDWIFGGINNNPIISSADMSVILADTSNVKIPVLIQNGMTVLDGYTNLDLHSITDILRVPVEGKCLVDIRNSTLTNAPSGEAAGSKWAVAEIFYTASQRTIVVHFNNGNSYHQTENGFNTGNWTAWKAF